MATQKIKNDLTPEGWEDNVIPLLLQGYRMQTVNGAAAQYRDEMKDKLTQFRGVATQFDYVAGNLAMYVNGVEETTWCDATISLKGGGQDLIFQEMAERYDYPLDLGEDDQVTIKTRIAGGQTIISTFELDPTTLSTLDLLSIQLLVYYETKDLFEWRKTIKFPAGTGIKRQSFRLEVDPNIISPTPQKLTATLPKNQGPIIGFSITGMSAELFNYFIDLSVNSYQVVKNVWGLRFSRVSQREPFIILYPFDAGSDFELSVTLTALIGNPGSVFITFYFDN
jgi:hypothetical protein